MANSAVVVTEVGPKEAKLEVASAAAALVEVEKVEEAAVFEAEKAMVVEMTVVAVARVATEALTDSSLERLEEIVVRAQRAAGIFAEYFLDGCNTDNLCVGLPECNRRLRRSLARSSAHCSLHNRDLRGQCCHHLDR